MALTIVFIQSGVQAKDQINRFDTYYLKCVDRYQVNIIDKKNLRMNVNKVVKVVKFGVWSF